MTDEMREQMLAKMLAEDDDVDLTDQLNSFHFSYLYFIIFYSI